MKHTKIIISTICFVTICASCSTAELTSNAGDVTQSTPTIYPTETPVQPTEIPTELPIEFPSGKFYNSSFDSYLIINDDGTWRLLEGTSRTFFTGLYQSEGEQVTFKEWSGYCSEFGDGIYRWSYVEGVLNLIIIKDACELRIARLTLPYTQQ